MDQPVPEGGSSRPVRLIVSPSSSRSSTSSTRSGRADFRPPPGNFLAYLRDKDGDHLVLLSGDIDNPRLVAFIETGDPPD